MFQRERGYKLVIGDYKTGQGTLIQNLHITFDITKTSNNKKKHNSAAIEIYNLSDDTLKKFETDFLACEFYCGYEDIGINRLLTGEIVQLSTRKTGADKVTQILLGEGYVALNNQKLAATVPPGKTVGDALEEIRRQMPGVVRGIFAGTNLSNPVIHGYPLHGTPKQMLDEISDTYNIDYYIDQGVLNISDAGGLTQNVKSRAFVLNKKTGLIEIPFFSAPVIKTVKGSKERKKGLQFKALLNTEIVPGSIVKVESVSVTGYYKVTTARYYGGYRDNDWYVECFCELPGADELK